MSRPFATECLPTWSLIRECTVRAGIAFLHNFEFGFPPPPPVDDVANPINLGSYRSSDYSVATLASTLDFFSPLSRLDPNKESVSGKYHRGGTLNIVWRLLSY